MGRRTVFALLVSAALAGAPVRAAVPSSPAVAIRSPVPFGPVTVALSCTISPSAIHGAWIAVFAVDADTTGLTESSVTALGWWDHGRLDVVVKTAGVDLAAPPVSVTTIGEHYRVSLSASWGGDHRRWAATLRGGCAASDATITDARTILSGRDVSSSTLAARLVTAGPGEFDEAVAVQGATVVRGTVSVEAPYLLGVFSAREGAIAATAPDGSVRRESGLSPSIPVRSGFGGVWRFDADGAISDDPYLLTALAFDDA